MNTAGQIDMFSHYEKMEELQNKKRDLERRISAIKNDFKSGLDPDSEEQAVQLENYEVLLEILRNTEDELDSVNKKIFELENVIY